MAIIAGFTVNLADRVWETTTTTGTGTYSTNGAVSGYRTFVAGVGSGNRCPYMAVLGTSWEVGIGTVTSGAPATLTRDSILASTNSNAAVNWGAGTKDIFLTAPASLLTQIFTQSTLPILRTPLATTSGSQSDFTGISASATEIAVMLNQVSTNGTSIPTLQIGDSGGIETTGYNYSVTSIVQGGGTFTGGASGATSFAFAVPWTASSPFSSHIRLNHVGSNLWIYSGVTASAVGNYTATFAGTKSLSTTLDRVRISTGNTFSGGSWTIKEVA